MSRQMTSALKTTTPMIQCYFQHVLSPNVSNTAAWSLASGLNRDAPPAPLPSVLHLRGSAVKFGVICNHWLDFQNKAGRQTIYSLTYYEFYSSTAGNLGVILTDRLPCTPNITAVAHCCRFALYNFHKGHNVTPGPSAGHLPPGLLQLALGLTSSLCD